MPKVYNKHHKNAPPGSIYIGRGSPWGNRFVIGHDGDREEVIAKHRSELLSNPEVVEAVKRELKGKDLVCFCAPKACHGDTLVAVANDE